MTNKQIIIDDQKKTIHRLQQECIEKTNTILALGDKLKCKEQECKELKKSVEHWQMEHKAAKAKGEWTYDLVKKRLGQQLDQLKFDYAELEKRHNDSFAQFEEIRKQNEKLKQYNDSKQVSYESMQQQWNEVELENRRLKVEKEEIKKYLGISHKTILKRLEKLTEFRDEDRDEIYKLKQTLTEIKEISEPYQKEIKKICGNCNNYDDCHACCNFDLNCYQYKKGDTTACEKFIVSWKYDKNKLANKILQKISEVENG